MKSKVGYIWSGMFILAACCCFAEGGSLTDAEQFLGAHRVSGVVFADTDGDSVQDAGEPGLAGVRLLAGRQAAVTGSDGAYVMVSYKPFLTLSVSFPSGYWPTGNRWFHRPSREVEEDVDFALKPEDQSLPFVFVHFTDPHLGLPEAAETIPAEAESWPAKPRFYLCGGDLRSTTVSVSETDKVRKDFGMMRESFARMNAPVFAVPGNHDVVDLVSNVKFPPEVSGHPFFGQRAWEKWVGPASWSFSAGGVLFIGQEWAEYTEQGWNSGTPAIKAWVVAEQKAQPAGTRVVTLCHAAPVLIDALALAGHSHALGPAYGSPRHLMGGHSNGHYTDAMWNSENTRKAEEKFVEKVPVRNRPDLYRRYGEDGCPSGYRIVTVYPDRMETMYKVMDEPRTIMVNQPRRNRAVTISNGVVHVRGQVFDPDGTLKSVTLSVGGETVTAELKRSLLWSDFSAALDAQGWADGCRTLSVNAVCADGAYQLNENYVFLSGTSEPFKEAADAVLRGGVDRGKAATDILFNGEKIGTVQPTDKAFAFPVRAELLKRLNLISLGSGGKDAMVCKEVRLVSGGAMFVDQHLTSGFGMGRSLRPDQSLYIDMTVPGKVTPWQVLAK